MSDEVNEELDQSALERWFLDQGMFAKDEKAAGKYLLAASDILLEGSEIPMALRISLGQALRESALVALDKGNKAAGDVLLKSLGLKKGGSDSKLIQAARAGVTNSELAARFNVGKNEVAVKVNKAREQDQELLNRRLSHTVSRLLMILDEMERGVYRIEVVKRLKDYLTSQNMLVDSGVIEKHIEAAFTLAKREQLIVIDDNISQIFRSSKKLP
ncbi:MAG: hypothetical protein QM484_13370 [Woeseiaceae bacterium]